MLLRQETWTAQTCKTKLRTERCIAELYRLKVRLKLGMTHSRDRPRNRAGERVCARLVAVTLCRSAGAIVADLDTWIRASLESEDGAARLWRCSSTGRYDRGQQSSEDYR